MAPRATPTRAARSRTKIARALFRFREKAIDPYVQEHIDLINAILKDSDLNETKNVTDSTLTAIMGREAAYSGRGVEWDDDPQLHLQVWLRNCLTSMLTR